MSAQKEMLVAVSLMCGCCEKAFSDLSKLEVNLRNAEATFGQNSTQYMDVLEIIKNYMSTMETGRTPPIRSTDTSKAPMNLQPFSNLVFRPKP
jgi:hypothetical protein